MLKKLVSHMGLELFHLFLFVEFFFLNLLGLQHLQKERVAWIFIGAFYFKDIHEQEKCYFQDIHEQEKANLDFFLNQILWINASSDGCECVLYFVVTQV